MRVYVGCKVLLKLEDSVSSAACQQIFTPLRGLEVSESLPTLVCVL